MVKKPENLVELFETAAKRFSSNSFIGARGPLGAYCYVTYGEVKRRVDSLRAGLASLGVGPGDAVGIVGKNSVDWVVCAYAAYGLRARYVPMYEAELESVRNYIIQDAAVKVLLVPDRQARDRTLRATEQISTLEHVIFIKGEGEHSLAALERVGRRNAVPFSMPAVDEVAMIIYTSGTTGDPKGVLLSHRNLTTTAVEGSAMVTGLDEHCRSLSILPWAHVYGLTGELFNFTYLGASIGIAESLSTIADDLCTVRPTHLVAVPRVFNRIYNGIRTKMEEKGGLQELLFHWSVDHAARKRQLAEQGRKSLRLDLKVALADKLVFKKIRKKLGGRLRVALTASATMNEEIARFFYDIGVTVLDCYGLTETSPAVTMNVLESVRFGSVGKPVTGVRVEIDKTAGDGTQKEGEVIVYGPNVMLGYHNKPEATAAVMTPDGGFRTGDLGCIDSDGYLHITGRIKEQFKLSNGKYVYPGAIEEEIKLLPEFTNAMIFGEGKDYNVCLLVPNYDYLRRWAKEHHLPETPAQLASSDALQEYLFRKVAGILEGKFGSYELPKKILFLEDDFTVDNGMLTQTLKLKRRAVIEHYKDRIDASYI